MVRSGRSLLDLRRPGQAAGMPVCQVRKDGIYLLCHIMLCFVNTMLCAIVLQEITLHYTMEGLFLGAFFWRPVFLVSLFLTPFCLSAGKKETTLTRREKPQSAGKKE